MGDKMKKIICLIMLILLVGCGVNTSVSTEEIEIGAILILTGEGSSWGTASKNGMEMANFTKKMILL